MGHRLARGYAGPCTNFHGHNYRVAVELAAIAGLNDCDMVMDFKEIKRLFGGWLDAHFDHAMCLPYDEKTYVVDFFTTNGFKVFHMPASHQNPTAENLAAMLGGIFAVMVSNMKVAVVAVTVWETSSACATWRAESHDKTV